MEFTEELPSWAVILSGLGMVAGGVAWRMLADKRDANKPHRESAETGEHRSSYLLVIVGIVWAGYGVVQAL